MHYRLAVVSVLLFACARVETQTYPEATGDPSTGPDDLALRATEDMRQGSPADLARLALPDLEASNEPDLGTDNQQKNSKCQIVINEIQTAGNAGAMDEFVEIYSGCDADVNLSGYSLVYEAAAGVNRISLVAFGNVTIPAAKPYLVVAHKSYTGSADERYSATSMSATGGSVGLLDPNNSVVSSVGWGTATNMLVENAAAPAPASAESIERRPNGQDTKDNSKDFSVQKSPTPGAPNQ
jgi:hypothetical protein